MGCGRPCDHAVTSYRFPQNISSTSLGGSEKVVLAAFAAFFALRPDGRECPFLALEHPQL